MRKILIADSGATKTDWAYVENGKPIFVKSAGLHPAYLSDSEMSGIIRKSVGKFSPNHIYFFGAGCHSDAVNERLKSVLKEELDTVWVEISDDLTGAAKAHLQNNDGLIAALGTGSICGRYQTGKITQRSAALGYAIGDEGSAADIGKRVLRNYFRLRFDDETQAYISDKLQVTSYSEWMERIYQSRHPNRELAKIAGMVLNDTFPAQVKTLLVDSIQLFIDSQLHQLQPKPDESIVCTGTVAASNREIVKNIFAKSGFQQVEIGGSVIEGLVDFYSE